MVSRVMIIPSYLKPTAISIFKSLPKPVRLRLRDRYASNIRGDLISDVFASSEQFETYIEEFNGKDIIGLRNSTIEEYYPKRSSFGGFGGASARRLYALVRAQKPNTVVETGVHHGTSTLILLSALDENGHGQLHSIDYPFHADVSIEDFREETYEGFGGAAPLPPDKEPGWIVPDPLRNRWTLQKGRVQRELPSLLNSIEGIDLYIRDSEHSLPCMLFEFEAAWEWLTHNGMIVSDDIHWNTAFNTFVNVRNADSGKITPTVGYMRKTK